MALKTAVVVVDLQPDFTEHHQGSLSVAGADRAYLEKVIEQTRQYKDQGLPVYATQDWHPADHVSFASNNPGTDPMSIIEIEGRGQIMWPDHCVQGESGADLLLPDELIDLVVRKGQDTNYDSYSGFADDGGATTGLEDLLKRDGVTDLIVYGLATDYCVKFTVLHAIEAGFKVTVILDLCRGVAPDTTLAAIDEMRDQGATIA
jgi:nicotinamidase/pyrazinamidase